MANFGLRHSDIIKLRKVDFLVDGTNKFKDSIIIWEKKTRKQRIVFVNQAVKEVLLMHLWNSDIGLMDYLITSNANNKGYEVETYIDSNGRKKTLRQNGKCVYKLDENGNKIPKPLSRQASENILKDIIVKHLGISLKNDMRCQDDDSALKIATHSLRKLYGWGITQDFINNFDADNAYAHTAALRFLSQDYGHSAEAITLRYSKDFDELKKSIVMRMNLGLNVIQKYYNKEATNYMANMHIG
jgi:integrase